MNSVFCVQETWWGLTGWLRLSFLGGGLYFGAGGRIGTQYCNPGRKHLLCQSPEISQKYFRRKDLSQLQPLTMGGVSPDLLAVCARR
jgi:hypothetical protein